MRQRLVQLLKYLITPAALAVLAVPLTANEFHPDFKLLNTEGQPWQQGDELSQAQTCGQCHNNDYIHKTLGPYHKLQLTDEQRLQYQLLGIRPAIKPGDSQCLNCHTGQDTTSLSEFTDEHGIVDSSRLVLTAPTSEACGNCHEQVYTDVEPLDITAKQQALMFGLTGEIFSGQSIRQSALNIADKENRHYSFDAHAERVVGCADCHGSANNPVQPPPQHNEKHLRFDPRSLSAHDYLQQPDHNFAEAHQCQDCHDTAATHNWLPFKNHHFSKLACESCHSNFIPAPAYAKVTFTGTDIQTSWRGIEDGLITGVTPWLLPAKNGKLAPFNLIEVTQGNNVRGVAKPIHHGIQSARATHACADCHSKNSALLRKLPVTPANLALPEGFNDKASPNLLSAGFYIIGTDALPIIDWLGLALVLSTFLAVSAHGAARYIAYRRSGAVPHQRKRVYMYSFYARVWHWLQAVLILVLLATGAAIHKPWLFSWLSFAGMVHIHNILGFVLLANAALALFYHLASGEIRQFIPMPADFFVRSIEQVQFYLKGIFQQAPHPFEKDPEHKLNPLQKIAYFGLLNVLLPAQVLTGLMIWGAQQWPSLAQAVGGLVVLGPLHSFLAWGFAAFLIMHIYLTTTSGPKPLSGIKAMIDGWEDVEIHGSEHHD